VGATAVVALPVQDSCEDGISSSLSPTTLLKLFQAHKPQFSGADQQDAQEFLCELLDTLHEDLKQPDAAAKGRMGKQTLDLPPSLPAAGMCSSTI